VTDHASWDRGGKSRGEKRKGGGGGGENPGVAKQIFGGTSKSEKRWGEELSLKPGGEDILKRERRK